MSCLTCFVSFSQLPNPQTGIVLIFPKRIPLLYNFIFCSGCFALELKHSLLKLPGHGVLQIFPACQARSELRNPIIFTEWSKYSNGIYLRVEAQATCQRHLSVSMGGLKELTTIPFQMKRLNNVESVCTMTHKASKMRQ